MLLDYFSGVKDLSDTLWKQISVNLKRAINIARKEPSILVTCLRIIEREEKADTLALQVKIHRNVLPRKSKYDLRFPCSF